MTVTSRAIKNSTLLIACVLGTIVTPVECPPAWAANAAITFIHCIQGSGATSPLEGETHTIEGVVIAQIQGDTERQGFFIQEEDLDNDGDPATSEGLFVYRPGSPVEVGDLIQVTGKVSEHHGMTQLHSINHPLRLIESGVPLPSFHSIGLPVPPGSSLEPYEGMRITIPETLFVSQNYFQGRYGQVTLSAEGRLYRPTHIFPPGSPGALAMAAENGRRTIVLDDGSFAQNPSPIPYIGRQNTLRAGDTTDDLKGVLAYGLTSNNIDGPRQYVLHPSEPVNFTRKNERPELPTSLGGELKVASFNVLNYFVTLDDSGAACGPAGDRNCRGANSSEEFIRQKMKLINAILKVDADILGLMEVENHPADAALLDLVDGLNARAGKGSYAAVRNGVIGTDTIKVALIYNSVSLSLDGGYAILDSKVNPAFRDDKNRVALTQTFVDAKGEKLTVSVNHLKSKGSDCDDLGDPDIGDGQGNCNQTRVNAAEALTEWLKSDPTNSRDPDMLIIGDLNAYAKEDPIQVMREAGYVNLQERFGGAEVYSFVFDGQAGALTHALATPSLAEQVRDMSVWHINADEPSVIDYNTEYKTVDLYSDSPYRASDHDPILIGLTLR